MRNAGALAEWILSLVTSRERAAAMIGDLVEEEASPLAFWGSIAWTALSLIWRDFSVAPLGMFGLAVYGLLISILFSAFQGVAAALLIVYVFPAALPALSMDRVIGTSLVLFWAGSFIAGILLARRAIDREMAACFAVSILNAVVTVAMAGDRAAPRVEGWYSGTLGPAFVLLLGQLFLLAGAACVRRRRLRHA
jgi:hypothetical protein